MEAAYVLLTSSAGMAVAGIVSFAAELNNSDLGPWVQGGSATIAVGTLAYIAKLFAQGSLVARDSAEAEKKLADNSIALVDALKDSHLREDRLYDLLMERREQG